MNWADIAIVVILVLSTVFGLFRGFVKETLALLAWIVAGWVGFTYCHSVETWLAPYISTSSLRIILAFIGLFIVTIFVISLINHLLVAVLHKTGLHPTDRSLGLVFGALRGILLVAIFILLLSFTSLKDQPWWKGSQLIPYFSPLANSLHDFIKSEMK
jgi:membrane protein required for colicin V production